MMPHVLISGSGESQQPEADETTAQVVEQSKSFIFVKIMFQKTRRSHLNQFL